MTTDRYRASIVLTAGALALLVGCDNPPRPAAKQPRPEASAEDTRQAILRLEGEWARALATKDLTWYDRHVAPGYRTIVGSGRPVPRAEVIDHVRNSPPARDLRIEQAEVRVHGDIAVAVVTQSFTLADGKPGRLRITDVWKRGARGRWQVVHSHESTLRADQR